MSDFHCLLLNKMQNQEQGKTIFFLLYPYFGKNKPCRIVNFLFALLLSRYTKEKWRTSCKGNWVCIASCCMVQKHALYASILRVKGLLSRINKTLSFFELCAMLRSPTPNSIMPRRSFSRVRRIWKGIVYFSRYCRRSIRSINILPIICWINTSTSWIFSEVCRR